MGSKSRWPRNFGPPNIASRQPRASLMRFRGYRTRVAMAVAEAEAPEDRIKWFERFRESMLDMRFLPAGRIIAGAGTARSVTLFNCFVMGTVPDSLAGIFDHLREAALTMQQGGGVGMDFSTIRPNGAAVEGVGADASGPLSFMDCWDSMCRTVHSAGQRRGAMMGLLAIDHPDIEAFIEAKRDPQRLRNFNMSVLVSDAFMDALQNDAAWPLQFRQGISDSASARPLGAANALNLRLRGAGVISLIASMPQIISGTAKRSAPAILAANRCSLRMGHACWVRSILPGWLPGRSRTGPQSMRSLWLILPPPPCECLMM